MVASQYIVHQDREKGTQTASQLVMVTGLISILMMGVLLLWGRQIFGVLFGKVEPDVLDSGLIYICGSPHILSLFWQCIMPVLVCSAVWERRKF